jgi:hypothetical protein
MHTETFVGIPKKKENLYDLCIDRSLILQEVLGRTNRLLPWYDTGHIENDTSNSSSVVAFVFVLF